MMNKGKTWASILVLIVIIVVVAVVYQGMGLNIPGVNSQTFEVHLVGRAEGLISAHWCYCGSQ